MDIKKGKYYKLKNEGLDEFILFPSGLIYNSMDNRVYCVGGSHSNKAQYYHVSRSKWHALSKTNYSHNGEDCASKLWFDHEYTYLLFIMSYYNQQIMMEKIDTRDSKNKWITCDNTELVKYLDFNVWHLAICS